MSAQSSALCANFIQARMRVARRAASRRPSPIPTAAASRFSITGMSRKSRTAWKVRARPRRPSSCGGRPVTSSPPSSTRPRVGRWKPVSTLTSVVLPAPLGPMSPKTSPFLIEIETPSTAASPSKWTVTSKASRVSSAVPAMPGVGAPIRAVRSLRASRSIMARYPGARRPAAGGRRRPRLPRRRPARCARPCRRATAPRARP